MRRRRRSHRRKNHTVRNIVISCFVITLLFATGYSAFSTNITLNAKGNIKECYVGQKWNFEFQSRSQEFTAICKGTYKIELWGAGNNFAGGGYTKGEIEFTNKDKLYVFVGEKGHDADSDAFGGYNGGGNSSDNGRSGATGAGSTDIRTITGNWDDFLSLKTRIMVAGGAGGSEINAYLGSNGGGLIGYDGYNTNSSYLQHSGKGGTQIAGGTSPTKQDCAITNGTVGTFGQGGIGGMSREKVSDIETGGGSGGGSGYFGGSGASGLCNGSFYGGGGSSFISGHTGCVAIDESSTVNNIIQRTGKNSVSCLDNPNAELCSNHYSNYVFNETVMIDGAGYEWTYEKGSYVGQPQPDGTTKKGNRDNGFARITLISLK